MPISWLLRFAALVLFVRAYNAFKDCQWSARAPTAQITEMREDGWFSYTAREGDVVRMQRCLEQRYGYKFQ